jgi:hypothetical protein
VEESVRIEELYEYRGTLDDRTVDVKLEFIEGVLWDIVLQVMTKEWVAESYVSCEGYSELMDRCFELALDAAERLLREVTLTAESHSLYIKRQRGEL